MKRYILTLLLVLCLAIDGRDQAQMNGWKKSYYVDKQLDQSYLNGIASFIAYLVTQKPSETYFNTEFQRIMASYPQAPHYFKLSLIKLFKNAFTQLHKQKQNSEGILSKEEMIWKYELMGYYETMYPLLDNQHKTFGYGQYRGKPLPSL